MISHADPKALVDQVLTVAEVARDLRCSKAHVYRIINGAVPGVIAIPALVMGRRRLVRRSSLEQWKAAHECIAGNAILLSEPKSIAVGRTKEN